MIKTLNVKFWFICRKSNYNEKGELLYPPHIGAGSHFENTAPFLSCSFFALLAVKLHGLTFLIGNVHRSRCIGRNRNSHSDSLTHFFPGRIDCTEWAFYPASNPIQLRQYIRTDDKMAKAGLLVIKLNTCQRLVKPFAHRAEHNMIEWHGSVPVLP